MEHTKNTLEPNKSLISSLFKVFDMFQLCIFMVNMIKKGMLWSLYLSSVEISIKTLVYIKEYITIEEMTTKFLLNEILNHVGMLWII